jgi:NAD(P)-dependent dehydrogenase (short-subunit alcohol dehydrogenase family)
VRAAELFDLSGRTAIVTGGGSGIGRQMATGLAEAGANLVLCARKPERCEEVAAELERDLGVRALGMRCDVRDQAEIQTVVDRTKVELGGVDILVNNAGTSWGAPAEEHPLEGWQKVIDVNLTGVFLFAQAAGRVMIERGGGKIVNIASVAAFGGAPPELMNAVAYNASKAGVVGFTRDLATKWARHGINVNAIAPGWFPSDMNKVLLDAQPDAYLERIPLQRFGGPDDLKGAVVFLASRASDYVTGQVVIVDGGQSTW